MDHSIWFFPDPFGLGIKSIVLHLGQGWVQVLFYALKYNCKYLNVSIIISTSTVDVARKYLSTSTQQMFLSTITKVLDPNQLVLAHALALANLLVTVFCIVMCKL